MIDENDKKRIQEMIDATVEKSLDFPTRKRGDTPTDNYQLTPLKFVTMNGSVAGRPTGSVATSGQFYLATDTTTPMWYTTNNNWINGIGSIVAIN